MFDDPEGPIEHFEWGRYQINGETHAMEGEGAGKDICILNGEVSEWSARKGHSLKPHMVSCVLNAGVDILVIGAGVYGKVKVGRKTQRAIKDAGISTLLIEKTPDACARYNRLVREGKRVALLAHGTC